jgi:hypothetical protein
MVFCLGNIEVLKVIYRNIKNKNDIEENNKFITAFKKLKQYQLNLHHKYLNHYKNIIYLQIMKIKV